MNRRKWPPTVQNCKGYARARGKDGQYYHFGKYGSKEAEQAFAEWLIEQTTSKEKDKSIITVEDVCTSWRSANKNRLAELELYIYENLIRALVRTFGEMPAKDFDALTLDKFRSVLQSGSWLAPEEIEEYRKKKQSIQLNRNTTNRRISRIKTMWRWAEFQRLVPKGSHGDLCVLPAWDGRSGIPEGKGHTPSSLEDAETVAAVASGCTGDMLLIQWWCGMRSAEVRVMRTCDLDRSGKIWIYRPSKHKGQWRGHDRNILVVPEAQVFLQKHLKPDTPEEFLFLTGGGKPYKDKYYAYQINLACQRVGVKVVPYGGRHAARDRIAAKYGPEIARIFLGHRHLSTTQIYGSRDIQAALDALLSDEDEKKAG